MWGEEEEGDFGDPSEEFYNPIKAFREKERRKKEAASHGNKKLKRKVVYVYESDSDEEGKPV